MPSQKNSVPGELPIQRRFFHPCRGALPPATGMAGELAESLGGRINSAYRPMRCKTELTLEEIFTITRWYSSTGGRACQLVADYRSTPADLNRTAGSGRSSRADASGTFHLYTSGVVLGTHCIYAVTGNSRWSCISFNGMDSLATHNTGFCAETDPWIRNPQRKGTFLSAVEEKQRHRFFNSRYRHVDECLAPVLQTP